MNVVDRTPRSGILWSGSTTVHVRPWRHEPTRAFLVIAGSHGPHIRLPAETVVESWLAQMTEWGYRSVRTSALSPAPAEVLTGLGFESVQQLTLMSAVLDRRTGRRVQPASGVRPLRRLPGRPYPNRITEPVLHVDRAAFGDQWCMDHDMLEESRTATRRSRLFVAGDAECPDGFLTVGVTGNTSFLQRLAVDPRAQRRGTGTRLVRAALEWASAVGATQSIVNTATDNFAALALYRSFGFHEMDHGLAVMGRSLP